jgi:Rrf2 family protein
MNNFFKISEAASLALHTMALLASGEEKVISAKESASTLNVSEAHLAKVLQRLSQAGYVDSARGPKGGFYLKKSPEDISLLEIYELMEGKIEPRNCLLDRPICRNGECIFGDRLVRMRDEIKEHLSNTSLSEAKNLFGGK